LKVLLKFLEEKIDHTDHGYIIGMHRHDYSISAVWERKEMMTARLKGADHE
jgi:hypothetical protein